MAIVEDGGFVVWDAGLESGVNIFGLGLVRVVIPCLPDIKQMIRFCFTNKVLNVHYQRRAR
jgi:hypothetical protein